MFPTGLWESALTQNKSWAEQFKLIVTFPFVCLVFFGDRKQFGTACWSEEGRSRKLVLNVDVCVVLGVVKQPFVSFCCLKPPQVEE